MKSSRDPRLVIALILLLVAVAFLGGTMRLIRSARAAVDLPVLAGNSADFISNFAKGRAENHLIQEATPTEEEATPAEQNTTSLASADTGGIIALAIVIVVTILLGSAVGVRTTSPKKPSPK